MPSNLSDTIKSSLVQQPLAIVGIACRLPDADSLSDFWDLLVKGRSAVGALPPRVLDREMHYDPRKGIRGKTYTSVGGLISERPVDLDALGLTALQSKEWDPCHLIFAEVAAQAWREMGSHSRTDAPTNAGVYIGHSGGSPCAGELVYATLAEQVADVLNDVADFKQLPQYSRNAIIQSLVHNMRDGLPSRQAGGRPYLEASAAARLVAERLGLTGPRMVLDAACASSLVALGLAALDLQSGAVDAAIVGGASYNKVDSLILFSQAQSCSATASRPFDAAADGLIASEGYIALVIKTLDKALADGDHIRGVIRGLGIATDGRGKSLWAPRREGQFLAMERAYDHVDPKSVQYVEAHATSTQVGDATETEALSNFFGTFHGLGSLPVGSVKSNIGHTLETAGLAGLLKTLLAMENETIPATINLENPSTSIAWDSVPFFVPQEPIAWKLPPNNQPRCGAINAFGIGGLNVHVVLEQYHAEYHQQLLASTRIGFAKQSNPKEVKGFSATQTVDPKNRFQEEPIAVVGIGVVLPGASSPDEVAGILDKPVGAFLSEPTVARWRNFIGLPQQQSAPVHAFASQIRIPTGKGGYLHDYAYDWKRHKVPPKQVSRANPLQFMLLDAASYALFGDEKQQAAYEAVKATAVDPLAARTSVVVGTIFGGEFGHQLQVGLRLQQLRSALRDSLPTDLKATESVQLLDAFENRLLEVNPALLDETGSFTSSTLASRITKQFNLMGGAMAVDAGDCSGEAALAVGVRLLQSGVSDRVLCAAGQRAMDLPSYQTWASRNQLVDDKNAPTLPAEGAVVLTLKRLSDAKKSGDKIFGVLDGVHQGSPKVLFNQTTGQQYSNNSSVFDNQQLTTRTGNLRAAQGLASIACICMNETLRLRGAWEVQSDSQTGVEYQVRLRGDATQAKHDATMAIQERSETIPVNQTSTTVSNHASATIPTAESTYLTSATMSYLNNQSRFQLVAVFPGQGSQSEGMLDEILDRSDRAKGVFQDANRILSELRSPSFDQLCRDLRSQPTLASQGNCSAKDSVWSVQATMLIADVVYWADLQEQSIVPDVVVGHSLGELAAMVAANVWSLKDALAFVRARAESVAKYTVPDSGLLSVAAPADQVREFLRSFGAPVWLTHENSPKQSVVGGTWRHLSSFEEAISQKGWRSVRLDVPSAFHTPLMATAQSMLFDSAVSARLVPPTIPILSTVSGRFVSDPEELRRNLLEQLITPVCYHYAIKRTLELGCQTLLEVGPGFVLTRLNQSICGKSESLKSISMESRSDVQSLMGSVRKDSALTRVFDPALSNVQGDAPKLFAAGTMQKFDATQIRKQRLRQQSQIATSDARPMRNAVSPLTANKPVLTSQALQSPIEPEHAIQPASLPALTSAQAQSEIAAEQKKDATKAELQAFVKDFIVEHTGYPSEMIELDWDLEADLGIDSIKQAQLFGELRELFDIDLKRIASGEIRTLRQIAELLETAGGKREWIIENDSKPSQDMNAVHIADAHATDSLHFNKHDSANLNVESTSSANVSSSNLSPAADSRQLANERLETIASFMVDFVIEHTGYPRELVELNADFEADLGLDSIKLAQLFGELRTDFDLKVDGDSRAVLAKCRTLADILKIFEDHHDQHSNLESEPTADAYHLNHVHVAETKELHSNGVLHGKLNDEHLPRKTGVRVDRESAPEYQKGKVWGRANAAVVHALVTNEIDRIETHGGTVALGVMDRLQPMEFVRTGELFTDDLDWWSGVADGASINKESLAFHRSRIDKTLREMETADEGDGSPENGDFTSAYGNSAAIEDGSVSPWPILDTPVTQRYQLKMVDAPAVNATAAIPKWVGAAVILGNNRLADELERSLVSQGVICHRVDANLPRATLIETLNQLWLKQPLLHAFITTPCDDAAQIRLSSSEWKQRRRAGMMASFDFCQHWLNKVIESGKIQQATLVGVTRLGGDFGLKKRITAPESGTLAGLLKAMVIESWVNGNRGLPIKVIDVGSIDNPADVVQSIYSELANPGYDMEIAFQGKQRFVVRAEPATLEDPSLAGRTRQKKITHGGSWIVTGGGRGITSFVAEELAVRYDLTLHLIGTAPVAEIPSSWRHLSEEGTRELKLHVLQDARKSHSEIDHLKFSADKSLTSINPIKAWQNIEKAIEIDATLNRLRSRGLRVFYYSCDCSNAPELKGIVDQIRKSSGPIRGCLHGAGVGQDARFDRKRPEKVEQCLSAKVDGVLALMEATQTDPIEVFIGFGSISGRFGANGHTDYSMANDGLAKCIGWYRHLRPEVRAINFHWHAWGDIGMATKPETKLALEMIDMQFMPAREGLAHLIREIEAGGNESEVLITDDRYYKAFYPAETLNTTSGNAQDHEEVFGLIERANSKVPHSWCKLDPLQDVFLREHVLDKMPLMPMVIGLEAMVESALAARRQSFLPKGSETLEVNQFTSHRPLRFFQDISQTIKLPVTPSSLGGHNVVLQADFHSRGGVLVEADRQYMTARVDVSDSQRLLPWALPSISKLNWQDAVYPPDGSAFFVGPAFRVLRQFALCKERLYGKILSPGLVELSGVRRKSEGWRTPSALIDACLFATGILAWNHVRSGINLPVSIERFKLHRMPQRGEICTIETVYQRHEEKRAWFDFCVWGNDGSIVLEAMSYQTAWL